MRKTVNTKYSDVDLFKIRTQLKQYQYTEPVRQILSTLGVEHTNNYISQVISQKGSIYNERVIDAAVIFLNKVKDGELTPTLARIGRPVTSLPNRKYSPAAIKYMKEVLKELEYSKLIVAELMNMGIHKTRAYVVLVVNRESYIEPVWQAAATVVLKHVRNKIISLGVVSTEVDDRLSESQIQSML